MKKFQNFTTALLTVFVLVSCAPAGKAKPEQLGKVEPGQYTFSRQFLPNSKYAPRGGTTTGPAVKLDEKPSKEWLALQEKGIGKFERDRRAILAMAGDYKVTFEFLETLAFKTPYELDRPYQSWTTERVYVIEDRGMFISLQHILVMQFVTEKGISEAFVTKHWRQDWTYEDGEYFSYEGNDTWKKYEVPEDIGPSIWTQKVYHVDDSPRYASYGVWKHTPSFSEWEGSSTGRPLPRRESSVRSDYDVLAGQNVHIILSNGWIHEQENLKKVLEGEKDVSYIAKEIGLNRYQRILDNDFSAGDNYWEKTKLYWEAVRETWVELFEEKEALTLKGGTSGNFMTHFDFAGGISAELPQETVAAQARANVLKHVLESRNDPVP